MSERQEKAGSNVTVEQDGIIYSINLNEKTAFVAKCQSSNDEIYIPRSILYKSTEYDIIGILKESFSNSKIKSIQFPDDSKLLSIEQKAFYASTIEKLCFPQSLIDLKNEWCIMTPQLSKIDVHPLNPRYICVNDKYIFGKSSMESMNYDVFVFCPRNAETLEIPSIIRFIGSCAFNDCKQIKTIQVSQNINLKTIEEDAFAGSSIDISHLNPIAKYISKPTERKKETPENVQFGNELYVFQNYNQKGIIYNCQYGKKRYIKDRCRSQILVPYTIHLKQDWEGEVEIINSVHSNHPKTSVVPLTYFTESQLEKEIENIYFSKTPHVKRYEAYNLLIEYIKKNTPESVQPIKVSKMFFNKIYNSLEYENQEKVDVDTFFNLRGENFLLFTMNLSQKESNDLCIIRCYASPFQIQMASQSKLIGIDCTFQTAPPQFKQVMVLMGKTTKINLPLAYILLPSKQEYVYKLALHTYKIYIKSFQHNVTFLSDFEQGEINAIKEELISEGNYFQLCYFHFVKALKHFFAQDFKEFSDNEKLLKEQNQNENPELNNERLQVKKNINKMLKRCAKMFPFIKHSKVYSAIEVFNGFSQTKKFAIYFSLTYLNRYSISDWSVFGKHESSNITNNIVERHNRKLNEMFNYPHPTLEEFQQKIAKLENEYFNMYENAEEIEENQHSHFTEHDFDVQFEELKNYLLNHVKQIKKTVEPQEPNDGITSALKIKDLPSEQLEFLKDVGRKYLSLPSHSHEKWLLLKDVEEKINNPKITVDKIRRWIFNNKESLEIGNPKSK